METQRVPTTTRRSLNVLTLSLGQHVIVYEMLASKESTSHNLVDVQACFHLTAIGHFPVMCASLATTQATQS
jgi:hypothetical protein